METFCNEVRDIVYQRLNLHDFAQREVLNFEENGYTYYIRKSMIGGVLPEICVERINCNLERFIASSKDYRVLKGFVKESAWIYEKEKCIRGFNIGDYTIVEYTRSKY
jgi:hypothetical protein